MLRTTQLKVILTAFVVVWAVLAVVMGQAQGVSPFLCLLPASLVLIVALPSATGLTRRLWFLPALALWSGITVPAMLLTFRWAAGLSSRCDQLFFACGLFAALAFLTLWAVSGVRTRWARQTGANRGAGRGRHAVGCSSGTGHIESL